MAEEPFRFLDLPAELRFKVYDYMCPEPMNEPQVFDTSHALRLVKAQLLQTSRCLREDILRHHFSSRIVAIFIHSPCSLSFDFLLAEAAYNAITRMELLIFCSLEMYRDVGRQIILSDYQQQLLEAGFNFTDKTTNLKSVRLSCSVFPGIMQFPRRPELYRRFEDLFALGKLEPFSIELEWVPSSATKVYPEPQELARAAAECEAGLHERLPRLTVRGIQCPSVCAAHRHKTAPKIQTSSTFGRRVRK